MADTEKKPTVTKEFVAKAAPVNVLIEREGRPAKEVEMVFGHLVTTKDGEAPRAVGRFRANITVVVDGMEVTSEGEAAKAEKALDACIRNANLGTAADWTYALDGEYFEQSYTPPKVDENDFWSNDAYKDMREEVALLRDEVEQRAEQVESAKDDAQKVSVEFAVFLRDLLKKVGGKMKVLESVLRGPAGSGDNHPRTQRLGKGANALREAMRFADLTPLMFAVLPNTVTSGKALDTHKSRSVSKLCSDISNKREYEWPESLTTKNGNRLPDLTSLGQLLRQLARKSFGVENAETDAMSLDEVMQAAAANGMEKVVEFQVQFGKEANSYAKDEYEAALMAYGRVLAVGDDGPQLLLNAASDLSALADRVAEPDAPADTAVEGLRRLFNNNLIVKRVIEEAWSHKTTVQTENENRELLNTTEEDSPFTQQTSKKLAQLSPDMQAAHIVQMIARLPLPGTVFHKVKVLGNQHGLSDPKVQEAAE